MNKELDKKLCEDFPEIFQNRHGDMRTTAMCWGFTCGDGWEPLIRATCNAIMSKITNNRRDVALIEEMIKTPNKGKWESEYYVQERADKLRESIQQLLKEVPVAAQVKEKFGGLRFYVHGANEKDSEIIRAAERMSYYICEDCSMMAGTMTYNIGWMKTLCPACADKHYGTEAADFRNKTGEWAE